MLNTGKERFPCNQNFWFELILEISIGEWNSLFQNTQFSECMESARGPYIICKVKNLTCVTLSFSLDCKFREINNIRQHP